MEDPIFTTLANKKVRKIKLLGRILELGNLIQAGKNFINMDQVRKVYVGKILTGRTKVVIHYHLGNRYDEFWFKVGFHN